MVTNEIPLLAELVALLKEYKQRVDVHSLPKKYVLSNRESHEILLVAR
jgi:hypothetical protein